MTHSASSLARLRLRAQKIQPVSGSRGESTEESIVRVVSRSLAMQGQDFAGVLWSIGLRVAGATEADVLAALASRRIVRSWPMRGTLHVIAAEDLEWMLGLTTPRLLRGIGPRREQLGLAEGDIERAREIAIEELSGGGILTRESIQEIWNERGIDTSGQRGYHLLWSLCQTGTLVFGPVQGKAHTFTLLREWVPNPREMERDEALGEAARRYFSSHGPATVKDFAWWASLTMGEARTGLSVALSHNEQELERIEVEGVEYWLAPGLTKAPAGTQLLPGFDEFLLGYQNRSAALPPQRAAAVVPGNNGVFKPTIVVDGQVVGTWKRVNRARGVQIEMAPFDDAAPVDVAKAASRLSTFVGLPVTSVGRSLVG